MLRNVHLRYGLQVLIAKWQYEMAKWADKLKEVQKYERHVKEHL